MQDLGSCFPSCIMQAFHLSVVTVLRVCESLHTFFETFLNFKVVSLLSYQGSALSYWTLLLSCLKQLLYSITLFRFCQQLFFKILFWLSEQFAHFRQRWQYITCPIFCQELFSNFFIFISVQYADLSTIRTIKSLNIFFFQTSPRLATGGKNPDIYVLFPIWNFQI